MKKIIIIMSAAILVVSCGTSRKAVVKREVPTKTVKKTEDLRDLNAAFSGKISTAIQNLIEDSEKYLGAPYKYAGNTSAGFDCSGFTEKVFGENKLQLPRRSSDQANAGKEIEIRQAAPGDLLFFATAGGNSVSHVGIVHDIGADGEVKFIHASTSKGVIISSLNEKYWNKAYLFTRRVL